MTTIGQLRDRNGELVTVGSHVKLVALPHDMRDRFNEDEWRDISSMLDGAFEICEIDEYGHPWIIKWWNEEQDESYAHSLAIQPEQMELVEGSELLRPDSND